MIDEGLNTSDCRLLNANGRLTQELYILYF